MVKVFINAESIKNAYPNFQINTNAFREFLDSIHSEDDQISIDVYSKFKGESFDELHDLSGGKIVRAFRGKELIPYSWRLNKFGVNNPEKQRGFKTTNTIDLQIAFEIGRSQNENLVLISGNYGLWRVACDYVFLNPRGSFTFCSPTKLPYSSFTPSKEEVDSSGRIKISSLEEVFIE